MPSPDPPPDPRRAPLLIGSEIYRRSTYGAKHPLAIPRVSTALDLIRALGWLDPARYVESPRASLDALARFHHPDYLAALRRAEVEQRVDPADRERFGIGANGNPVFREVFSRPATGAGGTTLAARLTLDGGTVHVPGGGTHHGQPARASGFCYLNDAVLGLLAWLDSGLDNILYVDIDAHHGDGVEDAFRDDPRVFTLSIHEKGRWPHTGRAENRAGGHARNLPVPPASTTARCCGCCIRRCCRSPATSNRRRSCSNAAPTRWRRTRCPACRCPTTPIGGWSAR